MTQSREADEGHGEIRITCSRAKSSSNKKENIRDTTQTKQTPH